MTANSISVESDISSSYIKLGLLLSHSLLQDMLPDTLLDTFVQLAWFSYFVLHKTTSDSDAYLC